MDINDALVALGAIVLIVGLALTHPALLMAAIGYIALTHGLSRSR